jgi:putative GTP pyrophosphokinase
MSDILREFDANERLYEDFTTKSCQLVTDLLNAAEIQVHSVTCRLKERPKIERKIAAEPGKYSKLSDITDIAGIRVITYFSEDVDRVSKIIEREFEIDRANSIDKRATLDPDRFGYLSLHYVVSLGKARATLSENRQFTGLKAEIQARSILQHAWAEIEHDIGYKTELAVPRDIRRRFSRLAGLLELADGEFIVIRKALAVYEAQVRKEIQSAPESVAIDKASLSAFIATNPQVRNLDEKIASLCSAKVDSELHPLVVENDVAVLNFLGIKTIARLDYQLRADEEKILVFAREWIGSKQKSVARSVCLLYLTYVLLGRTGDRNYLLQALNTLQVGSTSERQHLVDRVLATSRKVESSK